MSLEDAQRSLAERPRARRCERQARCARAARRGAGPARWLALVTLELLLGCAPAYAQADGLVRLPLVIHVATLAGAPVASGEQIAEWVARASLIFAPQRLGFVAAEVRGLAASHARQETRADRDALARHWAPGAIHCFVVASLLDVDEPGRVRRGVHWRARGAGARHYVIVSAIAGPDVLAHELGHFLGNPAHSDVPGNLMSYQRTDALPFLDAAQSSRLQRALRRYLRTRELVPD